ncbi:MAG: hypothetical protein Fues2KO_13960 [Fuerstiella sp.]
MQKRQKRTRDNNGEANCCNYQAVLQRSLVAWLVPQIRWALSWSDG